MDETSNKIESNLEIGSIESKEDAACMWVC